MEGWPSGLRRRPAKALGRKARVGSNPTPSVSPQEGPSFSRVDSGRVAEWLKAHDWKSCGCKPAWVRIPPRPCEMWFSPTLRDRVGFRGVAQSGRALRSGRRGPRFESGRPDW